MFSSDNADVFSSNSSDDSSPIEASRSGNALETNAFSNSATVNASVGQSDRPLLRIEAEDMTLDNYRLESFDFASNRIVASLRGEKRAEKGRAKVDFAGEEGTYDIILGYFDEEGGRAQLDPALNGRSLGKLRLDKNLGSRFAAPSTLVHRQIGENLSLKKGDTFTISGKEDKGEPARIDYVEFVPTDRSASSEQESDNGSSSDNRSSQEKPILRKDNASIRYITPDGRGDGRSWDQAAGLSDLDRLVERSQPGDEVWIAGDLGSYDVTRREIKLDSGGTDQAPIYIRGVASKGGSSRPLFVGDRAENWRPGKKDGGEVFRLLKGADHLHFSNLNFKNVGNGAFRFGGALKDITLEAIKATNVRRFVENQASGGEKTASISDLTIRNVEVAGFSKGAIRLQYDSHNILIEDVVGDSQQQDGDNFAMGIQLSGTVNNVMHRRVTMKNAVQKQSSSLYWNADGFVTEGGTYNITYEDTMASGNTDGGYDLKSKDTVLTRAQAADNKRNFRIWNSALMTDIVSSEPNLRGGIGTAAHIQVLGNGGNLTVESGEFRGDRGIDNIVFDLDDNGRLRVNNANITDNKYQLYTGDKRRLELKDVSKA